MASYLKIKGTDISSLVQSLTISSEPIWSSNTGRTASGKMTGDIVATKAKLEVQFVPLSDSQAQTIENLLCDAFFSVTYKNPKTNALSTITAYAGARTYPVYCYVNLLPRYVGTSVSLVEQ